MPEKRPEKRVTKKTVEKRPLFVKNPEKKEQIKRRLRQIQSAKKDYRFVKRYLTPEMGQIILHAPPLGIHGTLERDIRPMLRDMKKEGYCKGHYYYYAPDRHHLTNEEIIRGFFRSVPVVQRAGHFVFENGALQFVGERPAILLFLQKSGKQSLLLPVKLEVDRCFRAYEDPHSTFFSVIPVKLEDADVKSYLSSRGLKENYAVENPYFLIILFLHKIVSVLRDYKKKYGQHPDVRY